MERARAIFWSVFGLVLALKSYLAYIVPINGDEGEQIGWSKVLAWGYYDHPPLAAWLLSPVSYLGTHHVWLRLPTIVITMGIGYGIYRLVRRSDREKAYLIAALYLLTPVALFNVLALRDAFLLLLTFSCVACLFVGQETNRLRYYALSGIFLGAAFLAKYLMLPLLLGVGALFLLPGRIERRWLKLALVLGCSLPFVVQHVIWNYYNCWATVMFNLYSRNVQPDQSVLIFWRARIDWWEGLGMYAALLFYVLTPPVCYLALKHWRSFFARESFRRYGVLFLGALAPVAFFGMVSLGRRVGLHWIIYLQPLVFLALSPAISPLEVKRCLRFIGVFTGIHLLAIGVVLHLPLSFWSDEAAYAKVNWFFNYEKIVQQLEPHLDGFTLATPSYSQSYILSYRGREVVPVWGVGSAHGRNDDLVTDFRKLDGGNIAIVYRDGAPDPESYAPYFDRTEVRRFAMNDVPYDVVFGRGFSYGAYREGVLRRIRDRYYDIPSFLPTGACYFNDKYFREPAADRPVP